MKDILLLVIGAILGWISQWLFYRYQQRDVQRQGPNIVVTKIVQHGHTLCELRNIGNDSLSEMDVHMAWLAAGLSKKQELKNFFMPDQDIRTGPPKHVEFIGPGEKFLLNGLPQWTDDGLIDIEVAGFGVHSQRQYSINSQIV